MDTVDSSLALSKKFRSTWYIVLLVVSLFLSDCQSNSPKSESTAIPTNTVVATMTLAPTNTPTATPTEITEYSFHIDSQCPALSDELPIGQASGVLSYAGRKFDYNVLFNLATGQKSSLPSKGIGRLAKAIVSFDKNKIAYRDANPNTLEKFLVVSVLDEHKNMQRAWLSPTLDLTRWQDNQRLLFTDYANDPPYSHVVYDPFTEETVVLPANFPNISKKDVNWDRAGSIVYDQTLDYAIYAAWDEEKNEHEYVLWHIPSQKQLATLSGNAYGGYTLDYAGLHPLDGVTYNPPVWSTDDSHVALISSSPNKSNVDEIFTIAKNGNIQQLTEFASQYDAANLRTLSWSPDGEQIAFFITTKPELYGTNRNEQLAILDTKTGIVTLYCIDGDIIGTRAGMFIGDHEQVKAALWSLDGTKVIVENRYKSDDSRLILFDIPSNSAYILGQNMQPVGWMLDQP